MSCFPFAISVSRCPDSGQDRLHRAYLGDDIILRPMRRKQCCLANAGLKSGSRADGGGNGEGIAPTRNPPEILANLR
jgi:hypothetical protein